MQWGQNLELLYDRVWKHPDRVRNLYFVYLFVLRAVTKAADYLEQAEYNTGNPIEDLKTQSLVRQLLYNPKLLSACPVPFDEAKLWQGESGPELKQQIQKQFRNIRFAFANSTCNKNDSLSVFLSQSPSFFLGICVYKPVVVVVVDLSSYKVRRCVCWGHGCNTKAATASPALEAATAARGRRALATTLLSSASPPSSEFEGRDVRSGLCFRWRRSSLRCRGRLAAAKRRKPDMANTSSSSMRALRPEAWQKRRSRTGQTQQNRWSIRCRWTTKASGPRWQEEEIRWLQQKKHKMLYFCCTAEEDAGDIKRKGKKLSLDSGVEN
ncbi:hypothetical protein BHE74_00021062 [Ensete ventricosum]|nr:hypothetical protein BHE74_00021062 [Ensete ventricosum]